MNVRFEKKLWHLNMKPWLFKRLKIKMPDHLVSITEPTCHINSEKRRVKIRDLSSQ